MLAKLHVRRVLQGLLGVGRAVQHQIPGDDAVQLLCGFIVGGGGQGVGGLPNKPSAFFLADGDHPGNDILGLDIAGQVKQVRAKGDALRVAVGCVLYIVQIACSPVQTGEQGVMNCFVPGYQIAAVNVHKLALQNVPRFAVVLAVAELVQLLHKLRGVVCGLFPVDVHVDRAVFFRFDAVRCGFGVFFGHFNGAVKIIGLYWRSDGRGNNGLLCIIGFAALRDRVPAEGKLVVSCAPDKVIGSCMDLVQRPVLC